MLVSQHPAKSQREKREIGEGRSGQHNRKQRSRNWTAKKSGRRKPLPAHPNLKTTSLGPLPSPSHFSKQESSEISSLFFLILAEIKVVGLLSVVQNFVVLCWVFYPQNYGRTLSDCCRELNDKLRCVNGSLGL